MCGAVSRACTRLGAAGQVGLRAVRLAAGQLVAREAAAREEVGKHFDCAHLVQPLEVGLRQSQTHFDFVQLASDTQHEAHEFEKPRFSTHDCMHEVPEMMHRTAQPCTEPWSESNLAQVDATSLSA